MCFSSQPRKRSFGFELIDYALSLILKLKSGAVNIDAWIGKAAPSVAAKKSINKDFDLTRSRFQLGCFLGFAAIFVSMTAVCATFVHRYITAPIEPGHTLSPGIVLSKCGMNVFSKCESAYLIVGSSRVTYYQGNELVWIIQGQTCQELNDKACLNGLEFKEDRSLRLGGERIKWLERFSETGQKAKNMDHLVPWPFTEEPRIKAWVNYRSSIEKRKIIDDTKKAID